MKISDLFDGRLGAFLCSAAVAVVIGGGCTTKKAPNPYTGLMGARGVIPPPYATVEEANSRPAVTPRDGEPVIPADQLPPADDFTPIDNGALTPGDDFVVEDDVKPADNVAPAVKTEDKPAVKPAVKPVVKPAAGETYVVCKGDILSRIAAAHKVKVQDLLALNPSITNPARIVPGQKIVLPAGVKPVKVSAPKAAATAAKSVAPAKLGKDGIYTVVSGDNLSRIAKRYGVKIAQIREWNNLTSDSLKVGQKLRLRQDAAAAPAPKKAEVKPVAPVKPAEPAPAPAVPVENVPAVPVEQPENVVPPQEVSTAPEAAAPAAPATKVLPYFVGEKDSLESIANMFNITVDTILQDNPAIKSNADLVPGMEVVIRYSVTN